MWIWGDTIQPTIPLNFSLLSYKIGVIIEGKNMVAKNIAIKSTVVKKKNNSQKHNNNIKKQQHMM